MSKPSYLRGGAPAWMEGGFSNAGTFCKGCGRALPADGWQDVRVWCSPKCRVAEVQWDAYHGAKAVRLHRFIALFTAAQLMGPVAVL